MQMDKFYLNYTYPYQYLNPFTHYYDYWRQAHPQQQIWTYRQSSIEILPKIQDKQQEIVHKTQSDCLKIQQISQVQKRQTEKTHLTTQPNLVIFEHSLKGKPEMSSKHEQQQKENRNVYSNVLRNFFRKINDSSKIKELLKRIIINRRLKLTPQAFISYIRRLKINHGRYLRFKRLRHLFIDEKMAEHSIIFRILYENFLKEQLLVQTLTSRKIGRWSVILHLRGARDLKQKLFY